MLKGKNENVIEINQTTLKLYFQQFGCRIVFH